MAKSVPQIPNIKVSSLDRMTLSEIESKGLSHLIVKRKNIKRSPGRPRVIPDRKFQFSMSYWYGLIAADYHSLPRYQRARIALECWKSLLSRMKSIPSDPNESRLNAEEAMRMLGKLEGKQIKHSDGEEMTPQHSEVAAEIVVEGAPPRTDQPPQIDVPNLNENKGSE